MIPAGHLPVQLGSRLSATYQVLLKSASFMLLNQLKLLTPQKILDLICMKILNSDSQCIFRIELVEKLWVLRLYWNVLFVITYESKLT